MWWWCSRKFLTQGWRDAPVVKMAALPKYLSSVPNPHVMACKGLHLQVQRTWHSLPASLDCTWICHFWHRASCRPGWTQTLGDFELWPSYLHLWDDGREPLWPIYTVLGIYLGTAHIRRVLHQLINIPRPYLCSSWITQSYISYYRSTKWSKTLCIFYSTFYSYQWCVKELFGVLREGVEFPGE